MFETEIRSPPSVFAFLVQQFAICFGWFIWGLLNVDALNALSTKEGIFAAPLEAIEILLLAAVPALFLGRMAQIHMPELASVWIFAIPSVVTLIFLIGVGDDRGVWGVLSDLFFPVHNQYLSWLPVAFITYPTLGCIGYSAGIVMQRKRAPRPEASL